MKLAGNGMLNTVTNALAKHFSESAANVETFFVPASALPTGTGACFGQADGGPMKLRHWKVTRR